MGFTPTLDALDDDPQLAEPASATVENVNRRLEEVVERLIWVRTGGNVRELSVTVIGRKVRICGHTDTYYNKQLASHAVMDRFCEVQLTNEIAVD